VAGLAVLGFKAYYSAADTTELRWLIQPTAMLLNGIAGMSFQPLPSGAWLDAQRELVIVKACAGGNFLVASWLAYLWRWREQRFAVGLLLRACAMAWMTTLLANSLRILLIAHGQGLLVEATGYSEAACHRLLGVLVYFSLLCLQMAGAGGVLAASGLYLGVTLMLPLLHAWSHGQPGIDTEHAAWVMGTPLLVLFVHGVWRTIRRGGRRNGAPQHCPHRSTGSPWRSQPGPAGPPAMPSRML
jgi:exosortase K